MTHHEQSCSTILCVHTTSVFFVHIIDDGDDDDVEGCDLADISEDDNNHDTDSTAAAAVAADDVDNNDYDRNDHNYNSNTITNISNYISALGTPQLTVDGTALPSPRTVSTIVHDPVQFLGSRITVMLMEWGQFLAHDLSGTPEESLGE